MLGTRIRRLVLWAGGAVALYAVLGFLVAPPIVRSQLEGQLGALLGRKVTLERVRINPFALSASIQGFALKEPDGSTDFVAFDDLSADVALASILERGVIVEAVSLTKPRVRVVRSADGKYNFQDILDRFASAPAAPPGPPAASPRFAVYNIQLTGGRVEFDDRPAKKQHAVTDLEIGLPFVSSLPAEVDIVVLPRLSAKVNGTPFEMRGETKPFKDTREALLLIDIDKLELARYMQYAPLPLRVRVPSGTLSTRLVLAYTTGSREQQALELSGTATLERLVVQLADGAPLAALAKLSVEIASLDLLRGRATVSAVRLDAPVIDIERAKDGRLALLDAIPAGETTKEESSERPFLFSVAEIVLSGGQVRFVDRQPEKPFRLTLGNLSLNVDGLSNAPNTQAAVRMSGRINRTAPLALAGKGSFLSQNPALDLKVSLQKIELPAMSPYSIMYAGYAIEKGQLSMQHAYRVQDRRLVAENNLYVDQLTFGEKVPSPTATSLPVPLAVSLLKDRNGVIDLDLPVSGSLDDPDFKIRGLVAREVGKVVENAVTAPFALLGSLAGGGADLAYLEFAPGAAALDAPSRAKLKSLAKALYERPGLKLEVAGRVEESADGSALRRAAVERQVKAEKLKAAGAKTADGALLDSVTLEPGEYEKYLGPAYRAAAFERPRTESGALQELPAAEMERLLLGNAPVSEADLRSLAQARAQAVREWLVGTGELSPERASIIAPKMNAEGIKDSGKPTRVDFALK